MTQANFASYERTRQALIEIRNEARKEVEIIKQEREFELARVSSASRIPCMFTCFLPRQLNTAFYIRRKELRDMVTATFDPFVITEYLRPGDTSTEFMVAMCERVIRTSDGYILVMSEGAHIIESEPMQLPDDIKEEEMPGNLFKMKVNISPVYSHERELKMEILKIEKLPYYITADDNSSELSIKETTYASALYEDLKGLLDVRGVEQCKRACLEIADRLYREHKCLRLDPSEDVEKGYVYLRMYDKKVALIFNQAIPLCIIEDTLEMNSYEREVFRTEKGKKYREFSPAIAKQLRFHTITEKSNV